MVASRPCSTGVFPRLAPPARAVLLSPPAQCVDVESALRHAKVSCGWCIQTVHAKQARPTSHCRPACWPSDLARYRILGNGIKYLVAILESEDTAAGRAPGRMHAFAGLSAEEARWRHVRQSSAALQQQPHATRAGAAARQPAGGASGRRKTAAAAIPAATASVGGSARHAAPPLAPMLYLLTVRREPPRGRKLGPHAFALWAAFGWNSHEPC